MYAFTTYVSFVVPCAGSSSRPATIGGVWGSRVEIYRIKNVGISLIWVLKGGLSRESANILEIERFKHDTRV